MSEPTNIKIGHTIHGLGPGGAQKVIAAIARHAPEGSLHYVYSSSGGAFEPEVAEAAAAVRIVPRRLPRFDPLWVGDLGRAFGRDGVDLVHGHLFGDTLHGALAASRNRLPRIATLHSEYAFFTRMQRVAYRWLIPRLDATVACSEATLASWRTAFPKATEMLAIANGITPPEFQGSFSAPNSDPSTTQRLTLATVGRLEPAKGLDVLLRALALPSSGTAPRLLVIGEGSQRNALEAMTRDLGLSERVRFLGLSDTVGQLLMTVDCVVFPSVSEGLPMALLEAMAASRCLVISDLPGMTEAARPENEALVVPPQNPEALAGALERIAHEPGLRQRLGASARSRFEERYSAVRMASDYDALYRRLLSERGPT